MTRMSGTLPQMRDIFVPSGSATDGSVAASYCVPSAAGQATVCPIGAAFPCAKDIPGISGTLPTRLLNSLHSVMLSDSLLSGTIPAQTTDEWTNLRYAFLVWNKLSGVCVSASCLAAAFSLAGFSYKNNLISFPHCFHTVSSAFVGCIC